MRLKFWNIPCPKCDKGPHVRRSRILLGTSNHLAIAFQEISKRLSIRKLPPVLSFQFKVPRTSRSYRAHSSVSLISVSNIRLPTDCPLKRSICLSVSLLALTWLHIQHLLRQGSRATIPALPRFREFQLRVIACTDWLLSLDILDQKLFTSTISSQ